jgi:hypothetical protein
MKNLDKLIYVLFVAAVIIILAATFSSNFALIGLGFVVAGISIGMNVYRIKGSMTWKEWIAPVACLLVGISFMIMGLVI